jgi:uncharacterized membrane protein HdeD (DUF308 family)
VDEDFKNANIAAASGIVVAIAGLIAFGKDNEGALFLVVIATFVVAGIVKYRLDERAKRRRGQRDQ